MIDIEHEQLIPIRDVPRQLPPRRTGRRVHISAVYRWMNCGLRGVALESIRIGGTMYTSLGALQRFADRLSQPDRMESAMPSPTTAARQKQIEKVTHEVDAILGRRREKHR